MSWIGVGIAGGSAIIKGVTGAIQNGKANAIDRNNPFPTKSVDPLYQQNVNIAQQMSQVGLPQEQYQNQANAINRNQAGGLASLTRTGNNAGGIASIVRAGNDANNTLNAQDAMARNRNLLNLLQERRQLANQRDKAWDWNYQQKYLGNLAKSNSIRGAANQNINGAFNELGGTGIAMLGGGGSGGTGVGNFGYGKNGGYQAPANSGLATMGNPDNGVINGWGGTTL